MMDYSEWVEQRGKRKPRRPATQSQNLRRDLLEEARTIKNERQINLAARRLFK